MCQHTGEYKLHTRMVDYRPVRVYDCRSCGAQLAMDTLPAHLITRMYPLADKPSEQRDWPPVDFCVIVGGPNAVDLCRMFFWSLNEVTSTFGNVNFYLINRDLDSESFSQICDMVPGCKRWRRSPLPEGYVRGEQDRLVKDTEWSCSWAVENCGTNKFVVLSHFDVFFVADWLNYLRSQITDQVGILGQHCPFMLLNREAYAQSRFKFAYAGPFSVVPLKDHPDQCRMYLYNDERAEGSMRIGFDTGELLELELRYLGWECRPLREEYDNYFYHFTGGDRVREGPEFNSIRDRLDMFLEGYSIPEKVRVDVDRS